MVRKSNKDMLNRKIYSCSELTRTAGIGRLKHEGVLDNSIVQVGKIREISMG